MKILFINSLYTPYVVGGAETILRAHVNAMRQRDHEVSVLTLSPTSRLDTECVDGIRVWRAGLKNVFWPFGGEKPLIWKRMLWHLADVYNPLMMQAVRNVVNIEQPDIVCTHNLAGWSVSVWSELRKHNIPVVQVLHDTYLICPRSNMFNNGVPCQRQCLKCKAMRLFHPQMSNQVSAVVGVSRFILKRLLDYGYFSDVPVREVIQNARDMSITEGTGVTKRQQTNGQITFGFIGSLMASKGIELLLDTFVRQAPECWSLVVAGSGKGEYETSLKNRYRHDRINFIGRVPPEIFFTQVDFTVVPSLWEDTFPGVVFESFFFGVPVLGTKRGGIPEMIREGVNGALFDPGDSSSLLNLMRDAAANIDCWRTSAQMIAETSRDFSDTSAWTDKWETLYRSVLCMHGDRRKMLG